jgi:citrate lyase subunit beta / citryl-CoA lyase
VTVPCTALYVPGDRPERFDKAVTSGADTVILDLEDAVAPTRKDFARAAVVEWLSAPPTQAASELAKAGCLQVRINHPGSRWGRDDLAALPIGIAAIRLPGAESIGDVEAVQRAGVRSVHALIESAVGLESLRDIARHPMVVSIGLGEADLGAELGLGGETALAWARSQVVVAARAANLPAPMMSAFPSTTDLDGLAASCALGRSLGLWGRTAIHPRQLPVIAAAFEPTAEELRWADRVLDALSDAVGVAVLDDGTMVDEAMAKRARAWRQRAGR